MPSTLEAEQSLSRPITRRGLLALPVVLTATTLSACGIQDQERKLCNPSKIDLVQVALSSALGALLGGGFGALGMAAYEHKNKQEPGIYTRRSAIIGALVTGSYGAYLRLLSCE